MKSRKKRSSRPQPADDINRRPPRKSERAIARERYGHDDRQADRPSTRSRKSTSAHASPDPEGGGTSRSKQIAESRGEGAGRKEKDNEKARGHEHLIVSSPALLISSKHRITHQPPPHIQGTRTTPSRCHPITGQAIAPSAPRPTT